MTEGPIGKNLLLFALPIMAGNIAQSLNGSVNAIWIGRYLGEEAMTAAANANSIMFFLIGSGVRHRHGLDHPDRPSHGCT